MRCLLALNGFCDLDLRKVDHDFLVGVDGGTKNILRAGMKPDLVVGDFDSFDGEVEGSEVLKFPEEKDEIDAELALRECFERGAEKVLVACWRGERADMELALYELLASFPPLSVELISRKLFVFYVEGRFELDAKAGEKWSILPIGGDAIVTLKGFKYEIDQRRMPVGKPYGVSNVALKEKVIVETREGGVLVFRWREEPS